MACGDESLPNAEYGCRVYTVNYTSLNSVIDIKGTKKYQQGNVIIELLLSQFLKKRQNNNKISFAEYNLETNNIDPQVALNC